ncbi:lamin tail domain-containing protein [Carboxylicivirga sediminis]|uniref:Lamin tail domain-containing protein n=1 Tax=Carboxylicivirga sediminis TaxID=2006564 RepID=A0A941F2J0_9BACT|nr:lamin tail domain-containing protein [Carboxylicivirga sediminis]MBR8535556.1 lamin tail domain-containing protein [Carboxylicivirga sediminis]
MMRFFVLLLCLPLNLTAQLYESFSDNNFTTAPQWIGNDDKFIVNSEQLLQLNDTDAGTAYLSTACNIVEEASWTFRVQMGFNPSSSNLARVYLISNNSQLIEASTAVYVELGNTADNICLYKVVNGERTKLLEGVTGRLNLPAVDILVRVSRTANTWQLDVNDGNGWISEGTVNYEYNSPSAYFGWYCKYTKTRADKFFLDDIVVNGLPFSDKTPPIITQFELINGSSMQLSFNEPLEESSITIDNFSLANSGRQPSSYTYSNDNLELTLFFDPIIDDTDAEQLVVKNIKDTAGNSIEPVTIEFSYQVTRINSLRLIDTSTLELHFTKSVNANGFMNAIFTIDDYPIRIGDIKTISPTIYSVTLAEALNNGQTYQLTISNVTDAIGDIIPEKTSSIVFYQPKRFDVVFNEWMADPTPSMGLPEVEYIELLNTSEFELSLHNWKLWINNKQVTLPAATLPARAMICLLNSADADNWPEDVPAIFVDNMPALNNTGCELVLSDADDNIMDAFRYSPAAIPGEGFKREGGWSVERIDPLNQSGQKDNYHRCMNLSGGTPGTINSVYRGNADIQPPNIAQCVLQSNSTLLITFDETMLFTDNISVEIEPSLTIQRQESDSVFLRELTMHFTEPLHVNDAYRLSAIGISDWAGNLMHLEYPLLFGVPDSLEKNDLLINEVLFNPYTDGKDFVEIYNQSDKIINLSDLYLPEINEETIEKLHAIDNINQLLLPKSYVAISQNIAQLKQFYSCKDETALLEAQTLPTYPDQEGIVALTNKQGIILDVFNYSEQMHFDLLKDKEGISLERLSWESPTNDATNWHSAASTAGFATPGYTNSQTTEPFNPELHAKTISVTPEVFTPNSDGTTDFLNIYYTTEETGAIGTIRIYDSYGNEVRYLINNQTLAQTGYFTWDGLDEQSAALAPGIYIIYFQCIYASGKTVEERHTCVISAQNTN